MSLARRYLLLQERGGPSSPLIRRLRMNAEMVFQVDFALKVLRSLSATTPFSTSFAPILTVRRNIAVTLPMTTGLVADMQVIRHFAASIPVQLELDSSLIVSSDWGAAADLDVELNPELIVVRNLDSDVLIDLESLTALRITRNLETPASLAISESITVTVYRNLNIGTALNLGLEAVPQLVRTLQTNSLVATLVVSDAQVTRNLFETITADFGVSADIHIVRNVSAPSELGTALAPGLQVSRNLATSFPPVGLGLSTSLQVVRNLGTDIASTLSASYDIDVQAPTPIFLDTFTGSNGDNLFSHTPDIGSGWVNRSTGTWDINSNHAGPTGTWTFDPYWAALTDVGVSDYVLDVDLAYNRFVGIYVRFQDISHNFALIFLGDGFGSLGDVAIYKTNGGAPSLYALHDGTAPGAATTMHVTVTLNGTGYILAFDGGNSFSGTFDAFTTETEVGLYVANINPSLCFFDNFEVNSL